MPLPLLHATLRLGSRAAAAATLCSLLLSACGNSPPVQLYQLRADPPGGVRPSGAAETPAHPASINNTPPWALGSVHLPDYLDRDAILRPTGQSGLSMLKDQQWAEPLRDAVPRLLAQDLARLRGATSVWHLPLPPGVTVARVLQVDVEQFEARADGTAVTLVARWLLIDPTGKVPAQVFHSRLEAMSDAPTPDALVSAHRAALWQLAQDIQARAGTL